MSLEIIFNRISTLILSFNNCIRLERLMDCSSSGKAPSLQGNTVDYLHTRCEENIAESVHGVVYVLVPVEVLCMVTQ